MNPLIIVEQCYQRLPNEMKLRPWEITEHGRKVLQTEDELNAYIAAYGEMHIIKCRAALQNFPFDKLENTQYEIFDWGCGQGLATLTLLDMLQEHQLLYHLRRIYLIEPSYYALQRAISWVTQYAGPGIEIVPVNKSIPQNNDETMTDVHCQSHISINLFSNILDIRTLSLSWLAKKTSDLALTNYMVCIGPKFVQNTNTRISDFCGYFNPTEYFSNISIFPYSYTTRTHHAFGLETKCFVHNKENLINLNYQECAKDGTNTDTYDYSTEILQGAIDENIILFYNKLLKLHISYDVFFRPAINCDTADFVLASKSKGIILIDICENIEDIENTFKRIETVKNNLYNIHLKTIKIDSIICSNYNCIKTGLLFPNNTLKDIDNKIEQINKERNSQLDEKYGGNHTKKDYFAYLYKFTMESDLLELERISANGFKYEYYDELINLISTRWHSFKDGNLNFHLSQKQKDIVNNNSKRIRVKGVAGCGKTQVVANRAVEQHLKTGERVLIITFNISLIQYIKMRINQVPADFSLNMFEIINYHQFFKSKANIYSNKKIQLNDFDNVKFFENCKEKIHRYKSIIIDEVQDFKTSWLQLISNYFLTADGSMSVFGDGEQNIYGREMEAETKMPSLRGCGFPGGPWLTMNERISMRILNPHIASLSSKFAHEFMSYNIPISTQSSFIFEEYFIRYWYVDKTTNANSLVGNIRWIISKYHPNIKDTVILAQSINLLRDIEAAYTQATKQKTMINFETLYQYNLVKTNSNPLYIKKDLEEIRRAAKTHFTTDCDEIKLSTIHSFKGWEAKTIILLLQANAQLDETCESYEIIKRENTPTLIYTALTRAKCNLFIINIGNNTYHTFFKTHIG